MTKRQKRPVNTIKKFGKERKKKNRAANNQNNFSKIENHMQQCQNKFFRPKTKPHIIILP